MTALLVRVTAASSSLQIESLDGVKDSKRERYVEQQERKVQGMQYKLDVVSFHVTCPSALSNGRSFQPHDAHLDKTLHSGRRQIKQTSQATVPYMTTSCCRTAAGDQLKYNIIARLGAHRILC